MSGLIFNENVGSSDETEAKIEFSIPESLVGFGRYLTKAAYFRRAAGCKHCDLSRANDAGRPEPIRGSRYLVEGLAEAKKAGSLYLAEAFGDQVKIPPSLIHGLRSRRGRFPGALQRCVGD
jgi:hypothetical protein